MTNITNYLVDRAQGMLKTEPEVSDNLQIYSMFDDGGVEVETGEFLWGLTRILKPRYVLTTGIYTGISDMYIAQGLKDNEAGFSTALEFERKHLDRATELWHKTGVSDYIQGVLGLSLQYEPKEQYDLIFLDTEPQIRFAELEKFFPYLNPGGYVGIHDLPRTMCQGNVNPDHPEMKSYPFGDIPSGMMELLRTGQLIKIHFPTPRGLVFFYKPKEDDFNEYSG